MFCYYFFLLDFVEVNIEPSIDTKDVEMPEQIQSVVSSNGSDTFFNESKSFYNDALDEETNDDDLVEDAIDNDSDPSFKGGSEYLF